MAEVSREKPLSIRTDKFQFDLYNRAKKVRVSRLKIMAGEIVTGKVCFTLDSKDFRLYPQVLKVFKEAISSW